MLPWVSSCPCVTRAVLQVPDTVVCEAASASSGSPPKPSWKEAITLRCASATRSSGVRSGWMSGAPGVRACSGSNTAAKGAYVTSMARQAASAIAAVVATTAATRCPMNRTTGSKIRLSSGSSVRNSWRPVENLLVETFSWVNTATTPSIASAVEVSIDRMRACACGDVATRTMCIGAPNEPGSTSKV